MIKTTSWERSKHSSWAGRCLDTPERVTSAGRSAKFISGKVYQRMMLACWDELLCLSKCEDSADCDNNSNIWRGEQLWWAQGGFRLDAGKSGFKDGEGCWVRKTGLHTNIFGPGAVLRGPAKAWKKSGGLVKTSSSSSSKSARVFNRSGGRRGELLLS